MEITEEIKRKASRKRISESFSIVDDYSEGGIIRMRVLEDTGYLGCSGCYFCDFKDSGFNRCLHPACCGRYREDGRDVIFREIGGVRI